MADQFGHWAGIGHLIGAGPCEMIGSDIADRIAAGLDRMHAHIGQGLQHGGHIFEFWPVILDILARGEMAIALVPPLRDHRQLAHLAAVQRPIGDRHAQHIGMQLQIKPVHQTQRLELIFRKRAINPPRHLSRELRHAFAQKGFVKVTIEIHRAHLDTGSDLFLFSMGVI